MFKSIMRKVALYFTVVLVIGLMFASTAFSATNYKVTISGNKILLNAKETKILGLRCSNALISDETTSNADRQS